MVLVKFPLVFSSSLIGALIQVPFFRDEDMDGEWEAPQIANPKCESAPGCGAWQRPTIDNPNYKGKWKPPMIDNPNYQVNSLVLRCIARSLSR